MADRGDGRAWGTWTLKSIETMLDGLEWVPVEGGGELPDHSDLPYVTHEGVLNIGEHRLTCLQLSNGQRVFSEESIAEFFGLDIKDEGNG